MKVLLEMRPALDGYAGIPQEARLLFRGLRTLDGASVEGLIQSSGKVLAKGLPTTPSSWLGPLSADKKDCLFTQTPVDLVADVAGWSVAG